MHNENGLSEQEKVPRCHMLAPHSAPPHLSWRSGAFNLPEKHSACVCLWLAICLHRISFQFQSNSKHSHNMPQFTDVKKNTVTTLLSPSIASCSQKRMWSSKRCGLHTPTANYAAFELKKFSCFHVDVICHRTEVDTSDWLASETHSKSSHSEINRVCSVSFASVQIRKDYFFFEYYLFDFNLNCFLMFFVFFINPINSNWSASQTWSWWSWLPSCRAPRHFGNARRDLTHSTEWICGAYGGPWSHGKVLGAFLGPDKLISICRSHLAEVQSFIEVDCKFLQQNYSYWWWGCLLLSVAQIIALWNPSNLKKLEFFHQSSGHGISTCSFFSSRFPFNSGPKNPKIHLLPCFRFLSCFNGSSLLRSFLATRSRHETTARAACLKRTHHGMAMGWSSADAIKKIIEKHHFRPKFEHLDDIIMAKNSVCIQKKQRWMRSLQNLTENGPCPFPQLTKHCIWVVWLQGNAHNFAPREYQVWHSSWPQEWREEAGNWPKLIPLPSILLSFRSSFFD